ncbi:SRPBCC family protein, partial [Nonomuraea wenchangensis]
MMTDKFARVLGWTSLALGAAQLAAPRAVTRLCGVDDAPGATTVARLVGGRELLHAALLLGAKNPAQWAWTRVAGDTMDLGVLGRAAAGRTGARRTRALAALGAVAGLTALDTACARGGTAKTKGPLKVRASITINKPREDVYRFWRDLENLPTFMIHLDSVRTLGGGRSRWKAKGPIGALEWEAEIIDERVGDLIAWRS